MNYIGIDPGKSGAIAVIPEDGVPYCALFDEAVYKTLIAGLRHKSMVMLEQVGARPGQGVSSMFTFGANYGWIQGLLYAYDVPYQTVTPNKWKREFSVTKDKKSSVTVCQRLFPNVSLLATEKSRVPHDGLAEALLLAEYARRHM